MFERAGAESRLARLCLSTFFQAKPGLVLVMWSGVQVRGLGRESSLGALLGSGWGRTIRGGCNGAGGVPGAVWLLHTAGVIGWSRNLGDVFQCSHGGRCVLHKHGATCQGWERPKTPPVPPPCPRDSLTGRSRSSCGGLSEGFFKHKKSGLENKSSSPSPPCPHPTSPRRCTRPQSAEKARTC